MPEELLQVGGSWLYSTIHDVYDLQCMDLLALKPGMHGYGVQGGPSKIYPIPEDYIGRKKFSARENEPCGRLIMAFDFCIDERVSGRLLCVNH